MIGCESRIMHDVETWCALRRLLGCAAHESINDGAARVAQAGKAAASAAYVAARVVLEAPPIADPWTVIRAAVRASSELEPRAEEPR